MSDRDLCVRCHIEYPPDLVFPFASEGRMCGVCALAEINHLWTLTSYQFSDQGKERKRKAAVAFRADIGAPK